MCDPLLGARVRTGSDGEAAGERSDRVVVAVDADVGGGGTTTEKQQQFSGSALEADSSLGTETVATSIGQHDFEPVAPGEELGKSCEQQPGTPEGFVDFNRRGSGCEVVGAAEVFVVDPFLDKPDRCHRRQPIGNRGAGCEPMQKPVPTVALRLFYLSVTDGAQGLHASPRHRRREHSSQPVADHHGQTPPSLGHHQVRGYISSGPLRAQRRGIRAELPQGCADSDTFATAQVGQTHPNQLLVWVLSSVDKHRSRLRPSQGARACRWPAPASTGKPNSRRSSPPPSAVSSRAGTTTCPSRRSPASSASCRTRSTGTSRPKITSSSPYCAECSPGWQQRSRRRTKGWSRRCSGPPIRCTTCHLDGQSYATAPPTPRWPPSSPPSSTRSCASSSSSASSPTSTATTSTSPPTPSSLPSKARLPSGSERPTAIEQSPSPSNTL